MGTLSSDNCLLAEPLSSSGCSEGRSESAATSVFSGKIHSDSPGRLELLENGSWGNDKRNPTLHRKRHFVLSVPLFPLPCYFVQV